MRFRHLAAAFIGAALLAAPVDASGRDLVEAGLSLKGSNGYRITVGGSYGGGSLQVKQGNVGAAYVSSESSFTEEQIRLDLGGYGRVEVEFRPRGKPRRGTTPEGCRGKLWVQRGRYRGTIAFEGGFTRVAARRAKGSLELGRLTCSGPAPTPPAETNGTMLQARLQAVDGLTLFNAIQLDGRPQTTFFASRTVTDGAVQATGYAYGFAPSSSFAFNVTAGTATVRPPPPFTGEGRYVGRMLGESTWMGDLAVAMPTGSVPLTGGFSITLGRAQVDPSAEPPRAGPRAVGRSGGRR